MLLSGDDVTQLVLDLGHRAAFEREDFLVSASNSEAVGWIDRWPNWPGITIGVNLHGPAASGKTHLGSVWRSKTQAVWVDKPISSGDLVPGLLGNSRSVLLDGFSADWSGEPVLHLVNILMERGGTLLVLSREPLARMDIAPPDLASRLATLASAVIRDPDDALLVGVMSKQCRDRQIRVGRDVLIFLVGRMRRSFAEAARMVDLLDRVSLSERRPVTLSLARQLLVRADDQQIG